MSKILKNLSSEETIQKIEERFKVPEHAASQVKNIVEKVRGGYILFETRPPWDGRPGPWSKTGIAKVVFHNSLQSWKLYWMRASGKWNLYGQYQTLHDALVAIQKDERACFWG
jgi:DUF3024 family protein